MTVSPTGAGGGFLVFGQCPAPAPGGVSEVRQGDTPHDAGKRHRRDGAGRCLDPAGSIRFARARDCCAACVRPYVAPEVSLTTTGRRFRRAPGRRKRHTASGAWLDRVVLGRVTAAPVALLFLALILWITIYGANRPSELLADGLISSVTGWQLSRYGRLAPGFPVIAGWRVCDYCAVVAVMLPPMAIFFPLFTLLEDFGFLPRIAFSFDRCFGAVWRCGGSPDQCLHAPCGGRDAASSTACHDQNGGSLPAIRRSGRGATESLLPALLVTAMILLCVLLATLMVSRLLSATLLRGQPSAYLLEIPPYRVPDIPTVLVRSLLDRTLFVLGRAVAAAALPAPCYGW